MSLEAVAISENPWFFVLFMDEDKSKQCDSISLPTFSVNPYCLKDRTRHDFIHYVENMEMPQAQRSSNSSRELSVTRTFKMNKAL